MDELRDVHKDAAETVGADQVCRPAFDALRPASAHSVDTQALLSATSHAPGTYFVHTSTVANMSLNWTYIDHPLTNNNPDAIVLITQSWNPGGVDEQYHPHPIGVWYSSSAQRWAIFNQDLAAMITGVHFNVLIPATGPGTFVHTAAATNISGNSTYINHPLTTSNPDAIIFITQNWNPGGGAGTYNSFPIGVSYRSFSLQKWSIQNQTVIQIPVGAAFNVVVMPCTVYLPLVLR